MAFIILMTTSSSGKFNSISIYDKIMIWHFRLGYPSFIYLKHLFPTLFKNIDCSSFNCESCYLSKSYCVPYLSKSYHAFKPFYLIHIDVWDLS